MQLHIAYRIGVRSIHRGVLSQKNSWKGINDELKKAAIRGLLQETEKKLVPWLQKFEEDRFLCYMFKRRYGILAAF